MRVRVVFKEHVDADLRETLHSNFMSFALAELTETGDLEVSLTRPNRSKRLESTLSNYQKSGWISYEVK